VSERSPFEELEVLATVERGGRADEVRVRRVRLVENGLEFLDVRVFKPTWRGDVMLAHKGVCLRPNEAPTIAAALLKGAAR